VYQLSILFGQWHSVWGLKVSTVAKFVYWLRQSCRNVQKNSGGGWLFNVTAIECHIIGYMTRTHRLYFSFLFRSARIWIYRDCSHFRSDRHTICFPFSTSAHCIHYPFGSVHQHIYAHSLVPCFSSNTYTGKNACKVRTVRGYIKKHQGVTVTVSFRKL
jgi:hypothetical protein